MVKLPIRRHFFDFTCEAQPLGALVDGWSAPEPSGIWATGIRSNISIPLPSNTISATIKMTMSPFIFPELVDIQKIYLISHSQLLAEFNLIGQRTIELQISANIIQNQDVVDIELWHPHAMSPSTTKLSGDTRVLSICLHNIEVMATTERFGCDFQFIIMDGDSITQGVSGSLLTILCNMKSETSCPPIHDVSVWGETLVARSNCFSAHPIVKHFDKNTKGIVHFSAGSNDIRLTEDVDKTVAEMKKSLALYCSQARDFNLDIILSTILPRQDLTKEKENARLNYNEYLRTIWPSLADGLSDWAADNEMGASSFPTNANLCVDCIHPTQKGYDILAKISSDTINSLRK